MFRLYLDEVGTDGLTSLDKDKHRYLSLTGVAMRRDHARDHLTPYLNTLRAEIFQHDPDEPPIILHRKKILGFKGPFEKLRDATIRAEFDKAILQCFAQTDYTVITVLIDKQWMLRQRHWTKTHPYHWLMEVIAEKYAQFLERKNDIGDIMPESRGKQSDTALQLAFEAVRAAGTDFVERARIETAIPAKSLKFRRKPDNISGLQLCDLLAHPSHIHVRGRMEHDVTLGPFATKIIHILWDQKYDRSPYNGNVLGYGIKHFP